MTKLLAPRTLFPSFFDDDAFTLPSRLLERPFFRDTEVLPAVNIKDNTHSFDLELAVPGYKKEDLKVTMENDVLTISSEQKSEREEEKGGYSRREFKYNSFTRSFQLPQNADGDKVTAGYDAGVLKLSIPKTKATPKPSGREVRIA
ncbi:MAG: Hsp20/alpha crystallin family protein [Flavobacteriales bacterium]|nr:Hsp20/alpha crystallin family protein [Flavobacteriales bacterium]